ncbi:Translation protein SH3-like domain [Pseudocohnilembus persalinus]|uniref:50S ribosomal protein L19, chloroplastic n=1 Tax=Pseudocohnilembus persalinus TaxID=266149 RepID=A0A0V0QFW5_PSEPJ|nr:Translation protein SH3-like domain [Pseudocohnilembus persalinus]|eukprot:KRX01101.1 Translation protein SH3-like domain [Pseudocohnilembus persalinus]
MQTFKHLITKNQQNLQNFKILSYLPNNSIVQRYTPQRSPYDQTQYIEDYIPRNTPYHYKRKPQLPQWTDPNTVWPQLIQKATKNQGKALIQEIENEQKRNISLQRDFVSPDFRAGDVVQVQFMHGISEGKINTYTGIVIGRKKRNSLSASFKFIFRYCGVEVFMNVMENSPFLKDIKIVSRGQGNLRSQLTYLWNDKSLTADQVKRPIVTTKKQRKRKGDKISQSQSSKSTNIKYDQIDDPIFSSL